MSSCLTLARDRYLCGLGSEREGEGEGEGGGRESACVCVCVCVCVYTCICVATILLTVSSRDGTGCVQACDCRDTAMMAALHQIYTVLMSLPWAYR